MVFNEEEKSFFIEIQKLRDKINSNSLSRVSIEELFVKNIVANNLSHEAIGPTLGQFDALVDDIGLYIKKSFDEFLEFLREERGNKIKEY
jgi:hypothetical protein